MTSADAAGPGDARWRQRAVERSLRTARARAVSRSERFIAVATELLHQTGSIDFTVQELVERSQMSLRSFYQHFASKDDLLLAVFEEAIGVFVDRLGQQVAAQQEPLDRLRAYVLGFYTTIDPQTEPASRALSHYMLILTQTEPSELARVLAPQITLLMEIVADGQAAGVVRDDIPARHLTLLITQTLMAAMEMRVLGTYLTGEQISGDELWRFCTAGVLAGP
jgi:AcrR family transcriptional regulator